MCGMTLKQFNQYCRTFRGATKVVQWGGAHVWKIGGKVFAIGGWSDNENLAATFKVDPVAFDLLKNTPGCRPAPYLASRGMKWIQWTGPQTIDADEVRTLIKESYVLVADGLSKKLRSELGIE